LILVKFYTLNLPPPVLIKLVFMQREINSEIVLLTRNLFINYDKKEANSYMQLGRGIEGYALKACGRAGVQGLLVVDRGIGDHVRLQIDPERIVDAD